MLTLQHLPTTFFYSHIVFQYFVLDSRLYYFFCEHVMAHVSTIFMFCLLNFFHFSLDVLNVIQMYKLYGYACRGESCVFELDMSSEPIHYEHG